MMKKSPELITFDSVTLRYGAKVLWEELSFSIFPGEFVVVLGPNGAGKTSMFKTLLSLQSLYKGKIDKKAYLKMGYVAQIKSFSPNLPLRGIDIVKMGLTGSDYFLSLFSKNKGKKKQQMIDQAIAEVNAQGYAKRPLAQLSGGERQRLRIAQALVSKPELLLLDEPLVSLDITNQQIICNILEHQKKVHNTAIFMVTHEINPVINMVDKVVYIANGKAAIGKPEDILTSKMLSNLYQTPVEVIKKNGKIFTLVENNHHIKIEHLSGEEL